MLYCTVYLSFNGLSSDSSYLERSEEISEIDARLRALQEFMKKSLEPNKHRKK